MERILSALNGKAPIVRVVYQIFIIGIIFWMFCSIRDFPAQYTTKAEAQIIKQEIRHDMDRVFVKLESIESYLRDKK